MLVMFALPLKPNGAPSPPPGEAHWPSSGGPLDAWLRGELSKDYDQVLAEEVPEELLSILRMVH